LFLVLSQTNNNLIFKEMKNLIFVVSLFFVVLSGSAQTVNTGIARPEKGAFWKDGERGQISAYVFNNISTTSVGTVAGKRIKVEVVSQANTIQVLFADGEFAARNRNYVFLNPGEKLWRYENGNTWYLATCGNRIQEVKFVGTKVEYKTQYVDNTTQSSYSAYRPQVQAQPEKVVSYVNPCENVKNYMNVLITSYNNKQLSFKEANRKIEDLKIQNPGCYEIQGYILVNRNKGTVKKILIGAAVATATGLVVNYAVKAANSKKVVIPNNNPTNPNIPKVDPKPNPTPDPGYNPGTTPRTPVNDPPKNNPPSTPPTTNPPTTPPTTNPGTNPGPGYNPGGG
jgi:hypothetical protein